MPNCKQPDEPSSCPECGAPGDICWISTVGVFPGLGIPAKGFWTCDKFYDFETGRRDDRVKPNLAVHPSLQG